MRRIRVIVIILLLAGITMLLYPAVSNLWNNFHSSAAITDYNYRMEEMDESERLKLIADARAYNKKLAESFGAFAMDEGQKKIYEELLNINGDGIMGYIQIPSIDVLLPIYHGTGENVLQLGVGHLEWSSLPVGGDGSHCVLLAHRGLPSAKLFTDLDRLKIGDRFTLTVLDEIYIYEVDQIKTVLPEDLSEIRSEKGKELCTLVTCTPYGINTHRLLVRGHRVECDEFF